MSVHVHVCARVCAHAYLCVRLRKRPAGPLASIFSSAADHTAPLSPTVTAGMKIWTFTIRMQMFTLRSVRRHGRTLYFQMTTVCEREVRCAKLIMGHVRMLLNEASLGSP